MKLNYRTTCISRRAQFLFTFKINLFFPIFLLQTYLRMSAPFPSFFYSQEQDSLYAITPEKLVFSLSELQKKLSFLEGNPYCEGWACLTGCPGNSCIHDCQTQGHVGPWDYIFIVLPWNTRCLLAVLGAPPFVPHSPCGLQALEPHGLLAVPSRSHPSLGLTGTAMAGVCFIQQKHVLAQWCWHTGEVPVCPQSQEHFTQVSPMLIEISTYWHCHCMEGFSRKPSTFLTNQQQQQLTFTDMAIPELQSQIKRWNNELFWNIPELCRCN